MTRFVPGPRLDERVAARFAVPEARKLADALAGRVKANAPDAGVWITAQDERVRPTHRKADGQTIPDNLRYILDHPSRADTDASNGESGWSGGGQEMARAPRDPDLSLANRINCRCIAGKLPGLIAEHVHASDTVLAGSTARATVSVQFPRIVESEHPGPEDSGGGWLAQSVAEVAAERARSH